MKRACFTVLLLLTACRTDQDASDLDAVGRRLEETYGYARDSAKEIPRHAEELSTAAGEEVSKIYQLEYTVVDLNPAMSAPEIESRLRELGLQRWDCFFVRETLGSLQVFCKRHPKTFLRYIPRIF